VLRTFLSRIIYYFVGMRVTRRVSALAADIFYCPWKRGQYCFQLSFFSP